MEQLPDALFIVRQIDGMSHASSLKAAPNAARGRSIGRMLILYYQDVYKRQVQSRVFIDYVIITGIKFMLSLPIL